MQTPKTILFMNHNNLKQIEMDVKFKIQYALTPPFFSSQYTFRASVHLFGAVVVGSLISVVNYAYD